MKSELCLVTGAKGFVGRPLCMALVHLGRQVVATMRCALPKWVQEMSGFRISTMNADTDWGRSLQGCYSVIHCAARVHVMKDKVADPLHAYREVNVGGTLNLARQAADAGVRRFVFLSTIGVNGNSTLQGEAFAPTDTPSPHDLYRVSKLEAEDGLRDIAKKTGIEVVIIRPPHVYGCNAPGNFGSLMRAMQRGWPLPLGAVHNQRSLVALSNLVDFIVTCITHPQAANQTFLVSDGQDLSTTELVRGMAQAAGVPARNAAALAEVIKDLINNPARCQAMGDAGRALAESAFDVRHVVAAHLRIYQELINKS